MKFVTRDIPDYRVITIKLWLLTTQRTVRTERQFLFPAYTPIKTSCFQTTHDKSWLCRAHQSRRLNKKKKYLFILSECLSRCCCGTRVRNVNKRETFNGQVPRENFKIFVIIIAVDANFSNFNQPLRCLITDIYIYSAAAANTVSFTHFGGVKIGMDKVGERHQPSSAKTGPKNIVHDYGKR